jgi:YD repeat-containing protein
LEVLAGGDAKGQRIRYEYDKAIRLIALVNENNAAYQFAYDASDRLTEEKRIDNLTRRFSYNLGGHLTRVDEIGYGERAERPQRTTEFERDPIGHLHQLNLDGLLISDIERDDLHREVYRSQGKLTSCFGYNAMGRKAWQFASTLPGEKLSQIHNPGDNSLLVDHAYNPIHRRYEYDPAGELTRTLDKLRGEIKYEYEANGQLHSRDTGRLVDSEEFRYDAAANRLNFNTSQFDQVIDNRIKRWRDQEYA